MRKATTLGVALALALLCAATRAAVSDADPLPSWNDTGPKQESFKEFPIRQKPASFNLDEVMQKLSARQGNN